MEHPSFACCGCLGPTKCFHAAGCMLLTMVLDRACHWTRCARPQVGSEVARRGIGLGFAAVIAYDPYASDVKAAALGVKLVPWEEALARGDFFSLHMPMTATTKVRSHLVG